MKYSDLVNHKIAVVGATGFVGAYLTQLLRASSADVVELVRNVVDIPASPHVIAIGDIASRNSYDGIFDGINTVVYTVARTHQVGEDHPNFDNIYKEINCDAMIRMAKASQSQGVRRFIFLSSIKAVGEDTAAHTLYSNESIPEPDGPYGKSKLMAETALLELASSTDLEVVIIRPPLIYGPGVKGNLRLIIKAARYRIPLPLRGISKNRRSLVSLENLCSLISECVVNPAAANNIFFVKDQQDLSTVEIVRLLTENEGLEPILFALPERLLRLMFFAIRKSSTSQRLFGDLRVDDTFTRKTLGWIPSNSQKSRFNNE